MKTFTWDDTVRVKQIAPAQYRPGELASVVGITLETERKGEFLKLFPRGIVYTIEFEDGNSAEIHEDFLEKGAFPIEMKENPRNIGQTAQSTPSSWDIVEAEINEITASATYAFSGDTIGQVRDFLNFARTHCPVAHVNKGYWATICFNWPDVSFEVEVFKDHFETYRFFDGRTEIKHWPHKLGESFDSKFISELPKTDLRGP